MQDRTFLKTASAMAFSVVVMLLVISTGQERAMPSLPILETILVFPKGCVCPAPANPYEAERQRQACYYDTGEDLSWQMENLRGAWE